jgi:hypothetical protein
MAHAKVNGVSVSSGMFVMPVNKRLLMSYLREILFRRNLILYIIMINMLIAFSGKKKSGKDTCADLIAELCPKLKFCRVNFADGVYEEVACAIWPAQQYDRESILKRIAYMKANKDNFRLLLQGWGTNYRRNLFGESYWIEKYTKRHLEVPSDTVVVTTDVRFLNEANYIKSVGGTLIRVSRPDTDDFDDKHPSECELDKYDFDFHVNNNGTKEQLLEKLKEILKR